MNEQWRAIKNYEGIYEVSNLGNVRSLTRIILLSNGGKKMFEGKVLKATADNNGYLKVNLYDKNKKQKTFRIHTLVATHFVFNPHKLTFVNFKDGDKTNLKANNLFWTTELENNSRGASIGHKNRKAKKGVEG